MDMNYVVSFLEKIVNIPSPSGYTKEVMKVVEEEAKGFGYGAEYSRKGGLIITVPGKTGHCLGISAHVDTLGAMVRSVTSEGKLKLISVGGFTMESIEGMYCKVHTRTGKTYTGTILTTSPSVHVQDDARTLERKEKHMEVRLDEVVHNAEDVAELEIGTGDFISFDPMFVYTESGFIKSRQGICSGTDGCVKGHGRAEICTGNDSEAADQQFRGSGLWRKLGSGGCGRAAGSGHGLCW